MKFTKKDISNIKHYNNLIKKIMEINKIYENKINNIIPKYIKINLINYGLYTGRIKEIIHRRINFKDLEKNENADELIKETFGKDFFKWFTKDNNKFIYDGSNINNNININNNNPVHDKHI